VAPRQAGRRLPLASRPHRVAARPQHGLAPRANIGNRRFAAASASAAAAATEGLFSYSAVDIDGNDVDLGTFSGKVALVVNVASK